MLLLIPHTINTLVIATTANDFFESLWIDVSLKHKREFLFRLGLYYRTPSRNTRISVNSIIENFEPYTHVNRPVYVMGDFNFPSLRWNDLSDRVEGPDLDFAIKMFELGFSQLISDATYNSGNILDLIFANEPDTVIDISIEDPFSTSDHNKVNFEIGPFNLSNSPNITILDFKHADFDAIFTFINSCDWENIFIQCDTTDEMWRKLVDILQNCISCYVPKRVLSSQNVDWSKETRGFHGCQKNLHRIYKKFPTDSNKANWLEAAACARKSKRQDIYNSEKRILDSKCSNKFWSFVKSRLSTKKNIPCLINDENNVIFDEGDKANEFNKFFHSVFQANTDLNFDLSNVEVNHDLVPPEQELSRIEFSEEIVLEHLKQINAKNSSGTDGIPQNFLKKLAIVVSRPLSHIFTRSFECSEVPDMWKLSKVIPLHKKDGTHTVKNYRPISQLCSSDKVMESIVRQELVDHFHRHNILDSAQHGFLSKRSTVTQLLLCVNDWTKIVDNGYELDVVYLDIAKAFDSVSHQLLLTKLKNYGVTGKTLAWLEQYLTDRKQYVQLGQMQSGVVDVTSGVPQGSLLGPVLFLVYINDLCGIVRNSGLKLYADDAKIYVRIDKNSTLPDPNLNTDLENVFRWATEMKLSLALQKTAVLHIGIHSTVRQYYLHGVALPSVSEATDLGVLVSSNLKFSKHCLTISKKGFQMVNLIFKVFLCRDKGFLLQMFKTFIRPKLEYCTEVWSPYLLKDIDSIERVQKLFTRRLPGMQNLTYRERLNALDLEPLEERRLYRDMVMVYKIINNLVDLSPEEFFTFPTRETRGHPLKLSYPRFRLNCRKNFFSNRVVKVWNGLPESVVMAPSLSLFKKYLSNIDLSGHLKCRYL